MRLSRPVLTLTLLLGAAIGIATTASFDRHTTTEADDYIAPESLPVTVSGRRGRPDRGLPDFRAVVQELSPSVVNISTESEQESKLGDKPGFVEPFGHHFRGPRRSLGSGVIFDAEGYIITNHHVVEDASKIVVKLSDGVEFEGETVGTDEKTDLAVIKISPGEHPLVPAPLGDSASLAVGEWVLAIGNPFGLDNTVTAGIVSGIGRSINRRNPYDDFIQTDAAINPGNSGGPLVNLDGQVIGINTAIYSSSGGNIGIGFAIPVNMARVIIPQLKADGRVTRGWLGVRIQSVDEDIAASLGIEEAAGALVAEVFADSPASDAGLLIGDVIVEFDGAEVPTSSALPVIVAATPVGKEVEVVVMRDGSPELLLVEIGRLAEAAPERSEAKGGLGLSVQDLSEEMLEELELAEGTTGVVVTAVRSESPADRAGIRPGDVIEMVGNEPVESAEQFVDSIAESGEGESVLVLVRRGGQTLFRVIKPDAGD